MEEAKRRDSCVSPLISKQLPATWKLKEGLGSFLLPPVCSALLSARRWRALLMTVTHRGEIFSNWGGEEEAASGERGRKRSLYKAAKFKSIRREKCKRERAKFRKFCNCQVHYRSQLRPRNWIDIHPMDQTQNHPRCFHPTIFLKCMKEFSDPHGTIQQSPEVWKSRKVFVELGSVQNYKIMHRVSPCKVPSSTTASAFQTAPKELKCHHIFQHRFQTHKTGQKLNCGSW